jgi:hypothetical protein
MFLGACESNPSYIEPTVQPGGIRTPGIRFFPPSGGETTLPAGFRPCGQFTAKVTMEDGSTLTLSGCLYCAVDPRDPTVYVQHNCTGDYKKGIRDNFPARDVTPPPTKRLGNVGGSLSETQSKLKFTVDEEFEVVPAMLEAEKYGVKFLIADLPVQHWVSNGTLSFPAGTSVYVAGDNESVAGAMFWSFGAARIGGTTDGGQEFVVQVGRVESVDASGDFGLVLMGSLDGEVQEKVGHLWFPSN